MRLQEGEWVEMTGGNDKGKVGVIVSAYDEPGIGELFDVAFRDKKGRPDGQTSGVSEKWMKKIPRPAFNSSVQSQNRIVANALAARSARNAAGVRSGNRTQTRNMTDAQLKAWLRLIRCEGFYDKAVIVIKDVTQHIAL